MGDTERESRVGSRIGRYHLKRLIGKGGMGEVYEAEDTVKDRIVALKLLPEAMSDDPVFRARLHREAHSAGRLQEPHVVPIHDYGEVDGLLFVEMRMINGTDLRKVLKRSGPMPPARAVAIVRQIASALDAAHEVGVVHRDVKPENILITGDDFAYLVDFGIANAANDEKLTELGTAVGTYAYMAPERFTTDEVTYRVDVYALACVLHECLVGAQPYPGDSVSVVITAHLMQPPPRPSDLRPGIPRAFDEVIARGMAKKPDERYAAAGGLAQAANDALTARDQNQAATILQRSEAATFPGKTGPGLAAGGRPAYPTPPAPAPVTHPTPPSPPPAAHPTPPPMPVAYPTPPAQVGHPTPPPMPIATPTRPSGPRPMAGFYTPPPGQAEDSAQAAAASAPSPKAGARKRNLWVPVAAAGGAFAVVLGGVGVFWAVNNESSTSGSGPGPVTSTVETTSITSPAQDAAEASNDKLLGLLPRGYGRTACKPARTVASGALATVECGPGEIAGGPTAALYSLFPDRGALNDGFQRSIGAYQQLLRCPGFTNDSPTRWRSNLPEDDAAGRIACGTYNDKPDVVWTVESNLLLADVVGDNLDDLHKWWMEYA